MAFDHFLNLVRGWAEAEPKVLAVGLVGSYARGTATPESDLDLVILTTSPATYLDKLEWIRSFGEPSRVETEPWGIVTSVRVWYRDGAEVEFGITDENWGADPSDEGTASVIRDGLRVVFEKGGLLSSRAARIAAQ
jgi:predicted nucleotidyltransferase